MAATWKEVEADKDYQALEDSEKAEIKQRFWNNVITQDEEFKGLDDQQKGELQTRFFSSGPSTIEPPKPSTAKDIISMAVNTALPSAAYNQPITPTSGNPAMAALQAAGQTLRDPTRLAATSEQPGQVAGQKVQQATGSTLLGLGTQLALSPSMYMGGSGAFKTGQRAKQILTSGSRIGAAEKAAGVVTKAADKYPTSGTVGEVLNTLESQLDNKTLTNPQTLKEAKDIIDFVWKNPNLVGKSKGITVQAARVNHKIQSALNQAIIGRAGPAADFAKLQSVAAPIQQAGKAIMKYGPAGAVTLGSLAAIKHYLFNGTPRGQ